MVKKYDKFTTIYNVRDTLCNKVNIFRIILNKFQESEKSGKSVKSEEEFTTYRLELIVN
jgi:hypothetical protein